MLTRLAGGSRSHLLPMSMRGICKCFDLDVRDNTKHLHNIKSTYHQYNLRKFKLAFDHHDYECIHQLSKLVIVIYLSGRSQPVLLALFQPGRQGGERALIRYVVHEDL